jgi:hypothetical protein
MKLMPRKLSALMQINVDKNQTKPERNNIEQV